MMIGGHDIIFYVAPEIPAHERILGRIEASWPEARVRDPDEEALHGIRDPWVWDRGVHRRELVIYRDDAAAASWDLDGMTPENTALMLLSIVGEPSEIKEGLREVTLVCGERNEEMERLIGDLKADFGGVEADPDWSPVPSEVGRS